MSAGLERAYAAYVRRRRRADFDDVRVLCLLVGYPRSGHSVVGAILNAHPDAVIAHELIAADVLLAGATRDELFARMLARAWWFHLRGDRSRETGYRYRVPGQWQGRHRRLQVIGDKRGGNLSDRIAEHPDLLDRFARVTGVPLRLVHVERDPFDTIATIALRGRPLDAAAEVWLRQRRVVETLLGRDDLITIAHETLLAHPREELERLRAFLGLAPDEAWLEASVGVLFERPRRSREKVDWPDDIVARVRAASPARFEPPRSGMLRG